MHILHMQSPPLYTIDSTAIHRAMQRRGFENIQALAAHLGLHRNTLGAYLSGKRCLPDALEKMLAALQVQPGAVIRRNPSLALHQAEKIAPLLASLSKKNADLAFVLFGSRARGTEIEFSDFDIGFFAEKKTSFSHYSKLLDLVADWNENSEENVELADLHSAKSEFLSEIGRDLIFVGGHYQAYLAL